MLRITEHKITTSIRGWYKTAAYYGQGRGIVGLWGGKGAARLGLKGTVDWFSFYLLCDNVDRRTGKAVTVRMRANRIAGYRFTFSVCKSVSLLYGVSGDPTILDAFRSAVDESLREMEADMRTRIRKGGQDTERATGNMVWAEFVHTTASPVRGICDPQLHAYVFVFNMTWDEEEKRWKAGRFQELKRDAPYFEAAFRVRMANKLQDLGFGVQAKGKDFEIAGIPPDVLKRFSRRTEFIERCAQEEGITDPRKKAVLGPKTREKRRGTPWTLHFLRNKWKERLAEDELNGLASVCRHETPSARKSGGESVAVDQAIEDCFVREAMLPERKLLTEALKRGLGAVTVEGVRQELANRPLVRSEVGGQTMVRLGCN